MRFFFSSDIYGENIIVILELNSQKYTGLLSAGSSRSIYSQSYHTVPPGMSGFPTLTLIPVPVSTSESMLWEDMKWTEVLVSQLCLTLCDPMDCSPRGSSVHWILQARILEWVAIPLSRGSSQPTYWTWVCSTAGRFLTIWATMVPCIHLALQSPCWVQWLASCPQIFNGSERVGFSVYSALYLLLAQSPYS